MTHPTQIAAQMLQTKNARIADLETKLVALENLLLQQSKLLQTQDTIIRTAPRTAELEIKLATAYSLLRRTEVVPNTVMPPRLRRDINEFVATGAVSAEQENLDERMAAAGMYTIAEMMGVTPLTRWRSNPAINTIEAFSEWLDRKASEYLLMKARYDLGDKPKGDELYEWVLAHAGVFSAIRDQFVIVQANTKTEN